MNKMKKRIAIIHHDKCHPVECGNYLCAKICDVTVVIKI